MENNVIAHADQTSWIGWVIVATILMLYASIIGLVVSGSSCNPRIRKGCWLDPLTDAIPWLFSRAYLRSAGRAIPAWLPWAFAIFFYCSLALLAEAMR